MTSRLLRTSLGRRRFLTDLDGRRWPRSREAAASFGGTGGRRLRPVSYADTHSKRRNATDEMAHDATELRERAAQVPFPPVRRPSAPYPRVGGRTLCVRLPPAAVGHDGEVPRPAQLMRVRVPLRHGRGRAPAGRVPRHVPQPRHRAAVRLRPAGPLPGVLPRDAAC